MRNYPPANGTFDSAPNPYPPSEERRPHLVVRIGLVTLASMLIWQLMGWIHDVLPEGVQDVERHAHWVNTLVVFALAVPVVLLARRYLDRRPWNGLLTGPREAVRPFLAGVLTWLVPGGVGLGVCLSLGLVTLTPNVSAGELVITTLLLIVMVLLFEAVPEELIFRGYIFRNLHAAMSGGLAVLTQAVVFALFGTSLWVLAEGWGLLTQQLVLFFAMGLVAGTIRLVTGNVWASVGFHLVFQVVAQGLTGGYLFAVDGLEVLTAAVFLSPFVFGVPVVMLLCRTTGRWRGRVADPAPVPA